jgi:signal transduction histidine kinase
MRECCAAVARMAQKQQVKVEYELTPDITTVVSDQGKLRQILFNFVAWAVSRTPSGDAVKIVVSLSAPNLLNVTVLDTGAPIDDPAQVFDPEEKVREPNINELGIIIGRKLVDLMGGSVTLVNRDSGGLESHIQLPARPLKG